MKAPIFEDKKIEFWPPGIDYPFISRDEFNNKNVIPKDIIIQNSLFTSKEGTHRHSTVKMKTSLMLGS